MALTFLGVDAACLLHSSRSLRHERMKEEADVVTTTPGYVAATDGSHPNIDDAA